MSIYRQTLAQKGTLPTHSQILERLAVLRQPTTKILIVLQAGGHFVAALYQNNECIRHKTFRAYIVRGKAGGVQSQADKRSGAHKSVGAQMRRQNQVHFEEKITNLLKTWKSENVFTESLLKFVHVPHYARRIYFNDALFDKNDDTLRTIPFSTVKPGLREANRVFTELFTVAVYKTEENEDKLTQDDIFEASRKRRSDKEQKRLDAKLAKKKDQESSSSDEEDYMPYTGAFTKTCPKPSISNEGHMAISNAIEKLQPQRVKVRNKRRERKLSEAEAGGFSSPGSVASSRSHSRSRSASENQQPEISVNQICANGNLQDFNDLCTRIPYEIWIEESLDADRRRPLHIATRAGNVTLVRKLLELGASPEIQDMGKQTAYEAAREKHIRNIFRRYRHDNPNAWHWAKTKIDAPLSVEEEAAQKNKKKAKSKKNAQEKQKNEQAAIAAQKLAEKEAEEKEKSAKKLTPIEIERAKRLEAIQRRMAAAKQ